MSYWEEPRGYKWAPLVEGDPVIDDGTAMYSPEPRAAKAQERWVLPVQRGLARLDRAMEQGRLVLDTPLVLGMFNPESLRVGREAVQLPGLTRSETYDVPTTDVELPKAVRAFAKVRLRRCAVEGPETWECFEGRNDKGDTHRLSVAEYDDEDKPAVCSRQYYIDSEKRCVVLNQAEGTMETYADVHKRRDVFALVYSTQMGAVRVTRLTGYMARPKEPLVIANRQWVFERRAPRGHARLVHTKPQGEDDVVVDLVNTEVYVHGKLKERQLAFVGDAFRDGAQLCDRAISDQDSDVTGEYKRCKKEIEQQLP